MKIAGVILAGGRSQRMAPKNKLLLPLDDRTVIETTAANLVASKIDEVIVVTGFDRERVDLKLSAFESRNFRVVYNPNYESGRAESIKCAVTSLDDETDAVVFIPGDKPGLSTELIDKAINKYNSIRPALLYVKTPSGRGHPVIFARLLFDELMRLSGDTVGAGLIDKHADSTVILSSNLEQIDIDTPADYQRFLQQTAQVRTG